MLKSGVVALAGRLAPFALSLLCAAACAPRSSSGGATVIGDAARGAHADVAGEWRLDLRGPVQFPLLIEIVRVGDGTLRGHALNGDGTIAVDSVVQHGAQMRLVGRYLETPVVIQAGVSGDRITGEWRMLALRGAVDGERLAQQRAPAPVSRVDVADQVWRALERGFHDPTFNGQDWDSVRGPLLDRAARLTTDGELVTLIHELLRSLGSSHVGFSAAQPSVSVRGTATPAGNTMGGQVPGPVEWRALDGHTGYLRIRHFAVMGPALRDARAALDSAFAVLHELPALIIDLRSNPGGTLDLAALLAEHLTDTPMAAGAFVTQAGLRSRGLASVRDLPLHSLPRLPVGDSVSGANLYQLIEGKGGAAMLMMGGGPRRYEGRIALLVDGRTGSTAEAVAAALAELDCALTAGEPTAGAMLSSTSVFIEPAWQLRFPNMDFVTARGMRVEGTGVAPALRLREEDAVGRLQAALRAEPGGTACS